MNARHPVLFVPHGSPMFALRPGAAGAALSALVEQLETPRAIVVVSPHWETEAPVVGAARHLETIHDFGGFDPRLYTLQYPATGCPEAAQQVVSALVEAGVPATADSGRGLDHGAWVPLRHMFPDAEVPIVPLSIQHHLGPRHAHHVGQALAPLVEQGFLLLCPGNITHNLRDWQTASRQNLPSPPYVQQFADWVCEQVGEGRIDALLDYRAQQPNGVRAHPRDEHLLPLFTALGAAGPQLRGEAFYRGISDHVIAMDGYVFH
ncbi:MAG: dioxygenase [Gammaproteobacteria bacterium]|nr:dioxygenase [Gammaproteobacteria bacterium]